MRSPVSRSSRIRSSRLALTGALLLGAAASFAPTTASALDCATLPKPVYVTGAGKVILAGLGKALASSGITLVYKLQGSCLATDAILAGTKITSTPTDQAIYWDATGEQKCDLPVGGVVATLGLSDVFPETCFDLPNGLPMGIADFFGPVEAYNFVVPKASTQKSISHDAAYFVFGFGNASGVAPWTDETLMYIRNADSGTQQMLGAGIGVPPDRWKGTDAGSSGAVVMGMQTSTNPESTIGILTAEVAGANRSSLNVLAYQDTDQSCGYWPDSTPTATDKRNVRDGHYPLWGPLHLLTQVDALGYAIDPDTKDVVAYITGTKDVAMGFDLISLLQEASIIPSCAMTVQRTSELGALQSAAPNRACGCYFEALSTGSTDCQTCTGTADCPAERPACNYGYCEMQ